jgi:hypothetical protein
VLAQHLHAAVVDALAGESEIYHHRAPIRHCSTPS